MIFYFRAEVPDSADGRCDDADRRVADFLLQAASHLINGNHPGRVEAPDASADFGYTYSKGDQTRFADTLSLAAEAEAGYEVETISSGSIGRPRAEVVPIRVSPELKEVLEARAEAERTSVSEIIRTALRAPLAMRRCDHGCVICAPCGFIPESWRPS